jgi:UDP-2-acetamido-3-amino-2,3-dideoxy-glucuronate N-acetyltransferase
MEEPLKAECRQFLDCLQTRQRPRTDGENGLRVLEILDLCQRSLQEGGRVLAFGKEPQRGVFVHETACVEEPMGIGEGTQVWHYSHIMPGAKVGRNCILGQNVFIGSGAILGNQVKIQNNVSVYEGVILEDDVFCGPSMVFTNVFNPRSFISRKKEFRKTVIRRGATIGANATIVCGNEVGQYALIGAGSVVTDDIPDYALVYGNPGKIMGWVCQCAEGIAFRSGKAVCPICGKKYKKDSSGVRLI